MNDKQKAALDRVLAGGASLADHEVVDEILEAGRKQFAADLRAGKRQKRSGPATQTAQMKKEKAA